jgi:flagellar biogenesis protein FliO
LAVASALYYGTLTYLVSTLGTNLEVVTRALARVNIFLGILAAALFIVFGVWIVRRMKR